MTARRRRKDPRYQPKMLDINGLTYVVPHGVWAEFKSLHALLDSQARLLAAAAEREGRVA